LVQVVEEENKKLEELKEFFWKIEHKLTDFEIKRMELELSLIERYINETEHFKVSKKLIKLLKEENIKPLKSDVLEVLNRTYDIAGFGCRTSCISSSNIVLETEKLLKEENSDTFEFISVKGHMAPFIYANEYVKSNFSLLYLYSLHYANIISPIVDDKFTDQGITASYNLGYGLGRVLSLMMQNPNKKYIVLMGDSDLSFGATLEALMYMKTQNYNNLTLLIDFNRFGFEARPDGFDTTVLKSFFDKTIEVDEHNLNSSVDFKNMLFSFKRAAVFIHTKKEHHKITLFSANSENKIESVRLTEEYGKMVAELNSKHQKELLIFTPDLASRFFLQENNLSYINTTVAEVLTPILASKQDSFTAIATDQKYSTNMIGSLLELYKATGKVLLTLAKSWDYWGGEANALNLLNTLPDVTVYEPCSKEELYLLMESHYQHPSYKTIISISDVELPRLAFKPNLREHNMLIEKKSKNLIISFGIATALVYDVASELEIDLIHFTKMRLSYSKDLEEKLSEYDHVFLMEYNGRRNGFSEGFLTLYPLSNYTIKTSKELVPQLKAVEQIAYHGFSEEDLKTLFN